MIFLTSFLATAVRREENKWYGGISEHKSFNIFYNYAFN